MIEEWINKELGDLTNDFLFKKYFSQIPLIKDENIYYLSNKQEGIDVRLSNALKITSINLFSGKYTDSEMFRNALPHGVDFSFSRSDVQNSFGMPTKSGGGNRNLLFGNIPVWDKYYLDNYSIHFQYSADERSIDLVTLMSLELEPYFNSGLQ